MGTAMVLIVVGPLMALRYSRAAASKDGGIMEGPGGGVALRDQLADSVGRDRFELWVSDDTTVQLGDENAIEVVFPSGFLCDTARRNLGSELNRAAVALLGDSARVVLRVEETTGLAERPPVVKLASPLRSTPPTRPATPAKERQTGGTFDSLVVGRANQLAARAAAQLAAGAHSGGPLVIWGPPGTGKSHLLSAVKHAYRARNRRGRVLSLSAEQFVGTYVEALRGGGLPSFRQKCRGAHLLIIDDLHFMSGKKATLEELQHTLDRVTAAGGQVVVATRHEPGRIEKFGDELVSRLRAGLVCEVKPADYATRLQIARRRCAALGLEVQERVLEQLAAGVSAGARELLGAIERLRARHELLGEAIDDALVEQTASEINYQTTRRVAMDDIQRVVCDHFGIDAKSLRSTSRLKSVTEPRMVAMWLCRKYTQAGWREIGEYFGGRRHSTVISAHQRIESQVGPSSNHTSDGKLEDTLGQLETKLRLA